MYTTANFKHSETTEKIIKAFYKISVIIELKADGSLCEEHECQLLNYLKATDIEVGLLLNFGKKPEFKRKVFSNITASIKTNAINSDKQIV